MPRRSVRTILRLLAVLVGVLSIGDRGLHRLTGTEHGASHALDHDGPAASARDGDADCPLCRLAAEPMAQAGDLRAPSIDRPVARAEARPRPSRRPTPDLAVASSRGPPASA